MEGNGTLRLSHPSSAVYSSIASFLRLIWPRSERVTCVPGGASQSGTIDPLLVTCCPGPVLRCPTLYWCHGTPRSGHGRGTVIEAESDANRALFGSR
eukprot:2292085-Rhodomonas_salina.2